MVRGEGSLVKSVYSPGCWMDGVKGSAKVDKEDPDIGFREF